jgi:hypothetical protein
MRAGEAGIFRLSNSRTISKKEFPLFENFPNFVTFEVFTAVAMKNAVFCDVTPCGSCKNRSFVGK